MKKFKCLGYTTIAAAFIAGLSFGSVSYADNGEVQVEPVELMINFQIGGGFTGFTDLGEAVYTIGGPGYVPDNIFETGEISDKTEEGRVIADLQGAQITFSGDPSAPVVRFGCVAGSCTMTFKDGSVLTSDAGVPLEGRAINKWGPVVNSPDFDHQNGIVPIRIMGCGGLKGLEGSGRYAGMVGSICFNGQLNFDMNNQMVLTGSSKCTIVMHTPAPGVIIP